MRPVPAATGCFSCRDNKPVNEQIARDVVLVRAVESADAERAIFSNEDRMHASRAAAELARWRAGEQRQAASAESFIGQRAQLLAETLARRTPAIARTARAFAWPAWIDVALPVSAFALGALAEHVADRQHVNIVAFPLLAIVLWNIVVYVLLLLQPVLRASGAKVDLRGPRRWLAAGRQRLPSRLSGAASASLAAFVAQWSTQVASLMAARAARVLHLSAALLAIGAVAGLYMRGLVFEYRAGWESTFLDATQVHAILSFFLGPAAQLIGVAFPSVDQIAAMRFNNGASGSANAALWIHLYAVTVAVVVIVPRLLLALVAEWQQRLRSRRFTFDMNEPYFRRLAGAFTGGVIRLRVIPYSYTVDEAALAGLRAITTTLLGDDAEVALLPSVAFGAESSVSQVLAGADPAVSLTVALFGLAATPENENHGAFARLLRDALRSTLAPARLAVLIDEAGYRSRLGNQPGAEARLQERRAAWRYFCRALEIDAAFADLSAPDLPAIERDLECVLAAPASPL